MKLLKLVHLRWRRRLSLLASGALEGPEREAVLAHVERCSGCRTELESLRGLLALVAADSVRQTEPPVSVDALRARVLARLDEGDRRAWPGSRLAGRWALLLLAAATALAVAVLLARRPPAPPAAAEIRIPEDMLKRLEANVTREQAARYLSEAQDVLVTVASTASNCDRERGRVDLAAESERSRALLARRTLLVGADRPHLASVRPVLDDVEDMLREVASLDSCVRRRDVERVRAEMERRQLLMKIRLMTRELEG